MTAQFTPWASSASASVIPVRPPPKIITSCCMTASVPLPVRSVQNYLGKRDGYGKQFSDGDDGDDRRRSEEHTSELQSLMRISYAVFCLKKNKNYNDHHHTI